MTYQSDSKSRLVALMGGALILGACSDSADVPTGLVDGQPAVIELAVRVHLVQSDQLEALNVGLSDEEVSELMTAVNETWAQAGIRWSLESIVREDARNESMFRLALTDPDVTLASEARMPLSGNPTTMTSSPARMPRPPRNAATASVFPEGPLSRAKSLALSSAMMLAGDGDGRRTSLQPLTTCALVRTWPWLLT